MLTCRTVNTSIFVGVSCDDETFFFSTFPVHFWRYERDFLSEYCQAWVRLELDTHLAQQALREALDTKEVQEARERLNKITELAHVRPRKQNVFFI